MAEFDEPLLESDAGSDPIALFARWYARAAEVVRLAEACSVATVDELGRPSARMVLCKGFDEKGFVFYTHYDSRKGSDLAQNPFAAMLFYWDALGKQVRIEGVINKVSAEQSDAYFASRPKGAQIGAAVSHQSQPLERREMLDEAVRDRAAQIGEGTVARPPFWGGYLLEPSTIEFWQNREDRLHDRLVYRHEGGSWSRQRLQP